MCQWALITLTNARKTLEYMAYLGYNMYNNECQTNAINVTREKKLDLAKKQSSRNVYSCHVIGPKSSGKTTLCRTFVDPKLEVHILYQRISQFLRFFILILFLLEIKAGCSSTHRPRHSEHCACVRTGENHCSQGYQHFECPRRFDSVANPV